MQIVENHVSRLNQYTLLPPYSQGVPGERGPQGYAGVDGINVSIINVSELVDKHTCKLCNSMC